MGARLETPAATTSAGFVPGAVPPPPVPPVPVVVAPPAVPSGPNPALAGILGAIPFGVGAVYNGQYAKGLAHLIIFFLLVAGVSAEGRGTDMLNVLCGFGIAAFIAYQIVDAVRSAQAIRAGLPAPDPFGLAKTFSPGAKVDAKAIPTGALVLIVLGVLLLLNTAGLFELHFHRVWPVIFILLGGWLFATRWGLLGTPAGCTCERCRANGLMAPAVITTIGIVGLIRSFRDISALAYIGAVLLVVGGVKLFQGGASSAGHIEPGLPVPAPPSSQPTSTEVNRG